MSFNTSTRRRRRRKRRERREGRKGGRGRKDYRIQRNQGYPEHMAHRIYYGGSQEITEIKVRNIKPVWV